ncbi:hypothetical protein ACQP25_02920 [Microtetraspora malaysiensis]|uniref:hypothetical protein n=1 Tax=Microtetraspora malaysiensis TaxID=161358 RepID=UPI003D89F3F8
MDTAPQSTATLAQTSLLTVENATDKDLQLRPDGDPYFNGKENTDYKIVESNSSGFDRVKGALRPGGHLQLEIYLNHRVGLLVDFRPFDTDPWEENQAAHLHFQRYGKDGFIYDFTGQYHSPIDSKLVIDGQEIPSGARYHIDLPGGSSGPLAVNYVIGHRDHVPQPSQKMIAVSYRPVSTWAASWSNRRNASVNGKITSWRFTLQPEEFDIKNWKITFELPDGAFVEQTAAKVTENGRQITLENMSGEILTKGNSRDVDVQVFVTEHLDQAGSLTTISKLRGEGWL